MGLLDTLTGGSSSAATSDLDKALAAIQQVQTPTVESMQFQLQRLVQAGVLTPEKAQFYLANPSAYQTEVIPQIGTQAQEGAISGLENAAAAGGESPIEEAKMQQIIRELNTQEQGQRGAIEQNAAARGALTGGETMAAELQGNQADEANANELALGNAANAQELALQELTSAGSLGSGLQGQENTQANEVAAATDAINKFNAAQEQGTENFNVENTNTAQAANLQNLQNIENQNVEQENVHQEQQSQLPQEVYQDALAKAQAEAGVNTEQANLATGQGQQTLDILGGITNAVSPAVGSAFDKVTAPGAPGSGDQTFADLANQGMASTPPPGANYAPVAAAKGGLVEYLARGGGAVPGDADVPGDSPKNDKVPAMLSPGEVVLPRSITSNPQPDRVMDFLRRMRKPKTPHPDDVATVIHALGKVREVA